MKTLRTIPKPGKNEYSSYSEIYMELLEVDGQVLNHMRDNLQKVKKFIYDLPPDKLFTGMPKENGQ